MDQIKIVRVQCELHASNSKKFLSLVYQLTQTNPQQYMQENKKNAETKNKKLNPEKSLLNKIRRYGKSSDKKMTQSAKNEDVSIQIKEEEKAHYEIDESLMLIPNFKYLIIDCSSFIFIDSVGAKAIKKVIECYFF